MWGLAQYNLISHWSTQYYIYVCLLGQKGNWFVRKCASNVPNKYVCNVEHTVLCFRSGLNWQE